MRTCKMLLLFSLLTGHHFLQADCCDYIDDSFLPCWEVCTYPYTTNVRLAYNYFRGLPNGAAKRNSGGLASFNIGMPFWRKFNPNLLAQIGSSYAIYEFSGRRDKIDAHKNKKTERQAYATAGIAYKTPKDCGINAGLAFDLLFAQNFTQFAFKHSALTQIRYQAGYLIDESDELGFWGTVFGNESSHFTQEQGIHIHAVDQFNVFWSHYFAQCTRFSIWLGLPLTGGSNHFIAGGYLQLPINNCFSIEGDVAYMTAGRHRGVPRYSKKVEKDDSGKKVVIKLKNHGHSYFNVCFGITYLFGCSQEYHCHKIDYTPYMMLGGNSNFFLQSHVRNK